MAFELITRQEYKAYQGITSINHDVEIDNLIAKCSEFVKTYCRRCFLDHYDEAKTEYFSGGVPKFILSETPVVQVLAVDYSADYGQTWTALTEYSSWILHEDSIACIPVGDWQPQLRGYRVQYTAGYEVVPPDLKLAVMDLVTYYRRNDSAVHSATAPGTNGSKVEFINTTSLPANIRRVLDQYVSDYT